MGRREDLLRQEAEGWQRIDGLVGDLTPEQIERPGYTDEMVGQGHDVARGGVV
jgi:hypothetical protein